LADFVSRLLTVAGWLERLAVNRQRSFAIIVEGRGRRTVTGWG
jgi:hypothetical protein